MRPFVVAAVALVAMVALAASSVQATHSLLEEMTSLVEQPELRRREPVVKDSHVGYDLHKDFFYFNDKQADGAFKRSNYNKKPKITLAGQVPDLTERQVPAAVNPFAVAQKCLSSFSSSLDRWDVKENAHGHQFFALYQGDKSSFVVNKLRALLLGRLVNELHDFLPLLDQAATDPSVKGAVEPFQRMIKDIVVEIFRDVDAKIREQQADKDESSASATVVIVTQQYLLVVNLGAGRVVAHDGLSSRTYSLTHETFAPLDLFGLRKSKPAGYRVEPYVNIVPRFFRNQDEEEDDDDELYQIQFFLLETPSVAALMSNKEISTIVLSEIKNLRNDPKKEQDLYARPVTHILENVESKISMFKKLSNADHSVIMVGLERDYSQIH